MTGRMDAMVSIRLVGDEFLTRATTLFGTHRILWPDLSVAKIRVLFVPETDRVAHKATWIPTTPPQAGFLITAV